MWYFLIKQGALETKHYQHLQKRAELTEVETFNYPHENWGVFSVEKDNYQQFMDYLDSQGIEYTLLANRPSRAELLANELS